MADHSHGSSQWNQPPPAPPLPPGRAGGVFQKIIAPLSFNIGVRQHGTVQPTQPPIVSPGIIANRTQRHLASQTTAHRTGIPIAAIDINKAKTHAILAGQEILKTVQVQDGRMTEDFNLRSDIISYASAYAARSETANHRREYLPAKDVVWSKSDKYSTIIATAALNGRIALYDVNRIKSRIELAWIHEHIGQVNKLDFDPTGGYLLLSGSQDKTVRIWDIREPQSVKRKETINIRQPVRDVRWSPTDPGEFALCTENGVVQRWDLRVPTNALLSINAHEKACYAIDWHPDGRHLVSGGFDKYAKVWDFKSDNRRQAAMFSLRAPQAILNVRWRPPCWSSDMSEKGHWQSAQLATSYTDDDPRIHIWDLRRPLLPFREHDRYNVRPTDMLWASQDTLWSVGNLGMFTQTDIRYTTLLHDELPISATNFMPDSSFVAFSEDIRPRRKTSAEDPAAGFLRIPHERLSGGTEGTSRSISDEDEADEGLLTTSAPRRANKSSRATKSWGNTPPSGDVAQNIIPLDSAVLNRKGLFVNEQSGMASSITGLAASPDVVEFLADHYARPMTIEERLQNPTQILDKLGDAFAHNADVCDYVSMHRMAQSWRILGAVVIPELKDWADSNRTQRHEAELKRQTSPHASRSGRPTTGPLSNSALSRNKVKSNLFKGVTDSDRHGSDIESTSNMTTPTAKPLPDTPSSPHRHYGNHFLTLNETIEHIPPLPPSLLSSHSTAAAASRALLDNTGGDSPSSSPEKPRQPIPPRHKRSITDIPLVLTERPASQLQVPNSHAAAKQISSPLVPQSPRMELRKQEDRRAAIRDFRAQQRQLITLEGPLESPRYDNSSGRHGSSDSFPMFSASTNSSHRARSLGQSFDLPRNNSRRTRESEEWQTIRHEDAADTPTTDSSGSLLIRSRNSQGQFLEDESMLADFPMDEPSQPGLGYVEAREGRPSRPKPSAAASLWDIGELNAPENVTQSETVASSASANVFAFEEVPNVKKVRIYTSNPIRRMVSKAENTSAEPLELQGVSMEPREVGSQEYVHNDFRPIDFTAYEPKLPFAWSALPLICHSIAFDMSEGIASAQFSVHLLMHLHPFFFNPAQPIQTQPGVAPPDSITERLIRPDFSHRIIEGLFTNHYLYLKRMGLHKSMAELRKICVDFGFEEIFNPGGSDQTIGASLKQDPFLVQISCARCYTFMPRGNTICQNCREPRTSCPICLQRNVTHDEDDAKLDRLAPEGCSLWTFCQACGHGAHWSCMQEWMLQPGAEGECPTRGCGCDCGPGLVQQQRIARQHADAEAAAMIRGGRPSTGPKKDPVRASHSPAVDKTRDTLRNSDVSRNGSGDERPRRSFSGRGLSRSSIGVNGGSSRATNQGFGRRVRLVTPGEESGPSYSAS